MPGLIVMNNSGADAREAGSRKRTYDGKLVNGERAPRKDAAVANGPASVANTNGVPTPDVEVGSAQIADLPPEIVHLTSEHYHPLSRLFQRISQECFNDLKEVVQNMAELEPAQHLNGSISNGMGGYANGVPDNSETNKRKKLMMIQFAQHQRAKFIKLLVLIEWGKKSAAEISRLVDLFAWARQQSLAMDVVDDQLLNLKLWTNSARHMNPDIRTALQVLSTGEAPWIPDLGFIPAERLSAEKALQLLRYMNTNLYIRLNVHEQLPRYLRKWRVANGRATFVVDSEFELDVMSFSQDTSHPWLFIDLRLLFSPSPVITAASRFLRSLKPVVDNVLRQSGLTGCFDFLHNFILTHKIAMLRSQAVQLWRGSWANSIKIEPVHRFLVLQYWKDQPGKKSWIEIAISSCRSENGQVSWRGPPIPTLKVRWFRQGVEIRDVDLQFDFKNLSMERMLKRVIALHTTYLLRTTQAAILARMITKATFPETEPCDCSLEVFLGRPENKTIIAVQAMTGKFILRPCAPTSFRAERYINDSKDPLASIGTTITQLLAQTLQDCIQRCAQQLAWQLQTKSALRLEVIKQATKLNILQFSLFWPCGWTTDWALATVITASGETWWILELSAAGSQIEHAEQLQMQQAGRRPPVNRATLNSVERVAVQQLAFSVSKRECLKRNVPHLLTTETAFPPSTRHLSGSQACLRGWVLQLRTSDLLVAKSGQETWLGPSIRVMCQGFRADYQNISHIASGTMVKSVAADMQKLMSSSPQNSFIFSGNGTFSILLTTRFGAPVIEELGARLRDIDRLRSFASTLQKRKMRLMSSSLQEISFQYGISYSANVNFGQENNIKITFGATNPHNRIQALLTEMVNERRPFQTSDSDRTGLDRFCTTLLVTRSVLTALSDLENESAGNPQNLRVHVHEICKYRLAYANPLCSFDVHLRPKDDKLYWQIEDNEKKVPDLMPSALRVPNHKRSDNLKTALSTLFKGQGDGWFGVRSGIVAEVDGIPNALKTLHETIIGCATEGGNPTAGIGNELAPTSNGAQAIPTRPNTSGPVTAGNRQNVPQRGTPAMRQANMVNGMRHKQEVIELD